MAPFRMDLRGRQALVTGASAGIGKRFAEVLAARGANLVITARRRERLEQLAAALREKHGVTVSVIPLDLALGPSPGELFARTEEAGTQVDVLINCAGFATFGDFLDIPFERSAEMLRLNVLSLTEMTCRFGRAMRERGRGHILNVSSFVAYMPVPRYAVYAATKVYIRNFSEALAFELAPYGVRVLSLCPGMMPSEFWEIAGQTQVTFMIRLSRKGNEFVVDRALHALFGRRTNIVPGFLNKLGGFCTRLLPRRAGVRLASRIAGTPD